LIYSTGLLGAHRNFGIVTKAARQDIAYIHNRMPLVLDTKNERTVWLQKSSATAVSFIYNKQKSIASEHR